MARRSSSPLRWILLAIGLWVILGVAFVAAAWWAMRTARQEPEAFAPPDRTAERAEALAAFRDPTPPDPEQVREFAQFFDRLVAALANANGDMSEFFDAGRMYDEIERLGGFRA